MEYCQYGELRDTCVFFNNFTNNSIISTKFCTLLKKPIGTMTSKFWAILTFGVDGVVREQKRSAPPENKKGLRFQQLYNFYRLLSVNTLYIMYGRH